MNLEDQADQPIGKTMTKKVLQFLHEEDGLTTVEYALAGALITAALVAAFISLGDEVAAAITFITSVLP